MAPPRSCRSTVAVASEERRASRPLLRTSQDKGSDAHNQNADPLRNSERLSSRPSFLINTVRIVLPSWGHTSVLWWIRQRPLKTRRFMFHLLRDRRLHNTPWPSRKSHQNSRFWQRRSALFTCRCSSLDYHIVDVLLKIMWRCRIKAIMHVHVGSHVHVTHCR